MKRKKQYIIVGISMSIGILLWFTGKQVFLPIATIFFCLPSLILMGKKELSRPISFNKRKWSTKGFLSALLTILALALFLMAVFHLGEEKFLTLISKWYFAITLWLLCIAGLTKRYIEEKENVEKK